MDWDRICLVRRGSEIALPDPLSSETTILDPISDREPTQRQPEGKESQSVSVVLDDVQDEDIEIVVLDVQQLTETEDE